MPFCWAVQTSSNVEGNPHLGVGCGSWVRWTCSGGLDGWDLRVSWRGGGMMFPPSASLAYSFICVLSWGGVMGRASSSYVIAGPFPDLLGSPLCGINILKIMKGPCLEFW